jgi:hypothetical protein
MRQWSIARTLVASYAIVGGALGVSASLLTLARDFTSVAFLLFFSLEAGCGVMMLAGRRSAAHWLRWIQIFQVPKLVTPFLTYEIFSLMQTSIAFEGLTINLDYRLGSGWLFSALSHTRESLLGINVLPLIVALILRRSEMGTVPSSVQEANPARRVQLKYAVVGGIAVLLLMVFLVRGAEEQDTSLLALPSGNSVEVLRVTKIGSKDPALQVVYETMLDMGHAEAVESEMTEVWSIFKADAEKEGVRKVTIRAQEPLHGMVVGAGKAYVMTLERKADGQWGSPARDGV